MKHILGAVMAGFLAIAPTGFAFADHHAEPAVATEAAPTEGAAAGEAVVQKAREIHLKDGTVVHVDADMSAYTVDENGVKTPAAEGNHELADGTMLTVHEGHVTAGMPAEEASAEAMPAEATHEEAPAAAQ